MPDIQPLQWLLFGLVVMAAVGEALDVESVSIFSSVTPISLLNCTHLFVWAWSRN